VSRELDAITAKHKEQLSEEYPWIWLYEVTLPNDDVYRLTNYTEAVVYDNDGTSETYSPAPISHAGIQETEEGDIPKMTINIGNMSLELASIINDNDGLVGEPVKIILAHSLALSSSQSVEWIAEITSCTATDKAISFEVSAYSLYSAQIPAQRYMKRQCRHIYGKDMCGYEIPEDPSDVIGGGFATCGKTLEDCITRGEDEEERSVEKQHPLRFGGFPAIGRPSRTFRIK
jgi:lambda family phage minor tail protein L